jgi:hypothetical protein
VGALCSPCPQYCTGCIGTFCTSCANTFTEDTNLGTCSCLSTEFLYTAITPNQCLVCESIISNCDTCISDPMNPVNTLCQTCSAGFYKSSPDTCAPCDFTCASCTAVNTCDSCLTGYDLPIINGVCTACIGCISCKTTLGLGHD